MNTTILWIVIGVVVLIAIIAIIYAVTRIKDDRGRGARPVGRRGGASQRLDNDPPVERSGGVARGVGNDRGPGGRKGGERDRRPGETPRGGGARDDDPDQRRRGRRDGGRPPRG